MKSFYILFFIAIIGYSCSKSSSTPAPVSAYKPVLMSKNDLVQSVKWLSASELNNPGSYLLNGNFLYVVEMYKGVHVFDNSNPLVPVNTGFINIPGIQTISIKNNALFADNATDIVAIDLNNTSGAIVLSRIENVLPQPAPPDGLPLDGPVSQSTWPANTVVVGYEKLKN